MFERAMDGVSSAIDFYWQSPGMQPGEFHWFVLRDIDEPYDWYLAKHALMYGKRSFEQESGIASRV